MPRLILYIFLLVVALGMLFYSSYKDISWLFSKSEISQIQKTNILSNEQLVKINSKKIYINFPNKSQQYLLTDLGIVFKNNKERVLNKDKFNLFKTNLERELQYLSKNPSISLEKNEFYILGENSKISLDEEDFLKKVEFNEILKTEDLRIVPKFNESFSSIQNTESNQLLIDKMTRNSLMIKIGRQVFSLDSKRLQGLITKYQDQNDKEIVKVDKQKIESMLASIKSSYKLPAEFNMNEASQKLATHLLFRLTEEVHAKTLVLPITSSYTLKPDLHPKFIEVNKSNQRAYLFENGKMIRELVISTGITWETPTGNFKVLNKVPMTISYSRIWYMPWYLPIGTIYGKYYFGFHEIPYQVNYNGMIYSRDPETIGSPATGGCIQILKGQAKEVYDWADVGMPVYITENK